jgi:hypothetical protein
MQKKQLLIRLLFLRFIQAAGLRAVVPLAVRRPDIHSSTCQPGAALCGGEFARTALSSV